MLPETERWLEVVTDVLGLDLIEFNSDILDPLFNAPQEYIEVAKEIRIATQEAGVRIHNYFSGSIIPRLLYSGVNGQCLLPTPSVCCR